MKKPTIEETQKNAKIIYFTILGICLVSLSFFSYASHFVYSLTKGSGYAPVTIIVSLPVIIAGILLSVLLYSGKKKFYKFMRNEELSLYKKSK